MHFSLFIQRNTGATPFLCSVYASTSNTGIVIVVITKPDSASTLCWRKTGQWHCLPDPILTKYKDVFEGFGSFPGVYKIQLRPEVNPVIRIHPPRKHGPDSSPRQAGKRVGENGKFGSYCKSHGTHRQGYSIATPEKQRTGTLPVCLDPRDLNQAVKREYYPLRPWRNWHLCCRMLSILESLMPLQVISK